MFIASSIALNILLAVVLYSVVSSEESPSSEIIFFERSEENKIELDRDQVVRVAT